MAGSCAALRSRDFMPSGGSKARCWPTCSFSSVQLGGKNRSVLAGLIVFLGCGFVFHDLLDLLLDGERTLQMTITFFLWFLMSTAARQLDATLRITSYPSPYRALLDSVFAPFKLDFFRWLPGLHLTCLLGGLQKRLLVYVCLPVGVAVVGLAVGAADGAGDDGVGVVHTDSMCTPLLRVLRAGQPAARRHQRRHVR